MQIIQKRLSNQKMSQQDSNYLSRFVRPKLRTIASMNAQELLRKLDYTPKARAIEKKIKAIIFQQTSDVAAIIICGSAIQTNYREYGDIDVIIATKERIPLRKKSELIKNSERQGKKKGLNLDIQIYSKEAILAQSSSNPSLIYQLRDAKCIYGSLKLPSKIKIYPLDLKMKLDWSEGLNRRSSAREVYLALRNAMLVLLLINKKVDNTLLRENLDNILGYDLCVRLKNGTASSAEKNIALACLNAFVAYLESELAKPTWEKITIENL